MLALDFRRTMATLPLAEATEHFEFAKLLKPSSLNHGMYCKLKDKNSVNHTDCLDTYLWNRSGVN